MKKTISVVALFQKDSYIKPLFIIFNNTKYPIDRILKIELNSSLKSGGAGLRYTVRISNNLRYLFFEEDHWFIEKV